MAADVLTLVWIHFFIDRNIADTFYTRAEN